MTVTEPTTGQAGPVAARPKYVGGAVKRREDPRLLLGRGRYVADIRPAGTAYMAIVRSPHAHARITGVDTSRALAAPGVLSVLTWEDIKDETGTIPCIDLYPESLPTLQTALADGVVRYVGQPVAALVATSEYAAEDALSLVDVTYEPLPAVVDLDAAVAGATLLYPEHGTNVVTTIAQDVGDVDAAFAEAVRDRDTKLTQAFDAAVQAADIRITRTPPQAPRANAIAERWIRTLRRECLNNILITGPRHLDQVLAEYTTHRSSWPARSSTSRPGSRRRPWPTTSTTSARTSPPPWAPSASKTSPTTTSPTSYATSSPPDAAASHCAAASPPCPARSPTPSDNTASPTTQPATPTSPAHPDATAPAGHHHKPKQPNQ